MSRKKHAEHVNHERWLVSYADFITMLFALFVVLYSTANADKNKPKSIAAAITAAFQDLGMFPPGARKPTVDPNGGAADRVQMVNLVPPRKGAPAQPAPGSKGSGPKSIEDIHRQLAAALKRQLDAHTVVLRLNTEGLVISLREAGYYNSGVATPKPEAEESLRAIAAELAGSGHALRVEGHTDNIPIHTAQFASNWELSTARAVGLARTLMESGVEPERIGVAGYAEFHPVASNDTTEGRAQNRRVDIVVLRDTQEPQTGMQQTPGPQAGMQQMQGRQIGAHQTRAKQTGSRMHGMQTGGSMGLEAHELQR